MQEADRDRLDALGHQKLCGSAHFACIERYDHIAVAVHAFRYFQAMPARNKRDAP